MFGHPCSCTTRDVLPTVTRTLTHWSQRFTFRLLKSHQASYVRAHASTSYVPLVLGEWAWHSTYLVGAGVIRDALTVVHRVSAMRRVRSIHKT